MSDPQYDLVPEEFAEDVGSMTADQLLSRKAAVMETMLDQYESPEIRKVAGKLHNLCTKELMIRAGQDIEPSESQFGSGVAGYAIDVSSDDEPPVDGFSKGYGLGDDQTTGD